MRGYSDRLGHLVSGGGIQEICFVYVFFLIGLGKKWAQKTAAVAHHTTLCVCSNKTVSSGINTKMLEASCNNRIGQLKKPFDSSQNLNRAKVAPLYQACWCPLTRISVPHIHCYAARGNPSYSTTHFQRDVCTRLVRRRVIEGRKGWWVSEGWNHSLFCR